MEAEHYSIDRFEGCFAVLIGQNLKPFDIPRGLLPENAKEGDCVVYDGESFLLDFRLTQEKRESVRSRFDRLKKKG